MNYEIRKLGSAIAKNVGLTFSRIAHTEVELWNSPAAQDVWFESLAPGEVYESMFCTTPGWEDRDPVTATVCYRSGGLFPRLMDVDEHRGWRLLGRVTSWLSRGRVPRRKSFVLDPKGLFAMRYNVGYAGKEELGAIVKEMQRGRRERGLVSLDPSADVGSPADGSSRELTKPVVSSVVRTEAVTDKWAQRRPIGAPADPLGAYDRPVASMACRVGMSTDPHERIEYWKREEGHTTGSVIASGLTCDEAQIKEKEVAKRDGCAQTAGGPRKSGRVWSVYKVSGGVTSWSGGLREGWSPQPAQVVLEGV